MLVHPYVSHFILHKFCCEFDHSHGVEWNQSTADPFICLIKISLMPLLETLGVLTPPRMKRRGELMGTETVRKSGMCQKTKISLIKILNCSGYSCFL